MYNVPFAIGSLLFSITVSITANDIFPDNKIVEGLSAFTVLVNVCNLAIEIWSTKHGRAQKNGADLSGLPKWLKCTYFGMLLLFMFGEVVSIFLMTSWMLWAVYAPGSYLCYLTASLIALVIDLLIGACLKYVHHARLHRILKYLVSVVGILILIFIVFIIIRG